MSSLTASMPEAMTGAISSQSQIYVNADHTEVLICQMVITTGVAIASYGEVRFVLLGMILQLLAVGTESTRLILVQILLQVCQHSTKGSCKGILHQLSSLRKVGRFVIAWHGMLLNITRDLCANGHAEARTYAESYFDHVLHCPGLFHVPLRSVGLFREGRSPGASCGGGATLLMKLMLLCPLIWSRHTSSVKALAGRCGS